MGVPGLDPLHRAGRGGSLEGQRGAGLAGEGRSPPRRAGRDLGAPGTKRYLNVLCDAQF